MRLELLAQSTLVLFTPAEVLRGIEEGLPQWYSRSSRRSRPTRQAFLYDHLVHGHLLHGTRRVLVFKESPERGIRFPGANSVAELVRDYLQQVVEAYEGRPEPTSVRLQCHAHCRLALDHHHEGVAQLDPHAHVEVDLHFGF